MKNIRTLSCILTLLLCTAVSCEKAPPSETETTEPTETSAPETVRSDVLVSAETGQDYVLIRGDRSGDTEQALLRTLHDAILAQTGVDLAVKTDWYRDDKGAPPQSREILLGLTNREESSAVAAEIGETDTLHWIVRRTEEKLIIVGGSEAALENAVNYVMERYLTDGTLSVPVGTDILYEPQWPLDDIRIGKNSVSAYRIVTPAGAPHSVYVCAQTVRDYIYENTGHTLPLVTDAEPAQDFEILVGDTNRTAPYSSSAAYSCSASVEGSRLVLRGDPVILPLSVLAFTEGEMGETADDVYTVEKNVPYSAGSLMDSAVIRAIKVYTDLRAKLGRAAHLASHNVNAEAKNLLDVDIYGNDAAAVLTMPADEANEKEIASANAIVRKVAGYMTTDIPTSKKESNGGNGVTGENDFAAIRLVRLLYLEEGILEEETLTRLDRFFRNDDFMSRFRSENHMLLSRTARYLAACHYEGRHFNQYRMSAEKLRDTDCAYLKEFLLYRAKNGWAEFDSMPYLKESFLALLVLYDCAPDEDLRELARMSMDSILLNVMMDCTDNAIYGGAHGRNYGIVVNTLETDIYWLYSLYFGASGPDWIPEKMPTADGSLIFTSSYRPHDILYALAASKTYPYSNYETVHNHNWDGWEPKDFGFISKYTYNTALYSIGSVNAQDSFPSTYEEYQQTNWSLTFAENGQAALTVHHPGNTEGHSYWYGDQGCFCNHLFGHENVVTGIYRIEKAGSSNNFIHAYVPKEQFDEVIEDAGTNSIFVRLGDAYAMLRFSEKYSWKSGKEVTVYDGSRKEDIRLAFVCEAGDKATWGSFTSFVTAMKEKTMRFDRENLSLSYGTMTLQLETTGSAVREIHTLAGEIQSYPYKALYDSPWLYSERGSGVLTVTADGYVRTMDFMQLKDTCEKIS